MIRDTISNPTRAGNIQRVIQNVMETEHKYLMHGDRLNPVRLPWMPFQPASFIGIMWDCMAEIDGDYFLDVGCGPGTKMEIARELFGMRPYGIELDGDMASLARHVGPVWQGDALKMFAVVDAYAAADIIWLYRPFRAPEQERRLEERIIAHMKPGAILAGGAWETEVPALGWQTVVDDWEIRHGAWQKPRTP